MKRDNNDFIFEQAIRTADILVKMFGQRCEVAVHDFSNLENSLIYLSGTITGRKIGSPITDLVLKELTKNPAEVKDIPNYKTISEKGAVLKSSTVFLRSQDGNIIGAMCINFDISSLIAMGNELGELINFDQNLATTENFYLTVHDVIEDMIKQVLQGFNKAPTLLDMDEKVECVRKLENMGAFLIKGATEYLASVLGVSKFTIYNYLQKIRTYKEYQSLEEFKSI